MKGLIGCFIFQLIWYLVNKLGIVPPMSSSNVVISFIMKELINLIGILPAVYIGVFLRMGNFIPMIYEAYYAEFRNKNLGKYTLGVIWIVLFIVVNLVHKAAFTLMSAFITFILFNLWEKGQYSKAFFTFFGVHSTNIWLTHMFFYTGLFEGLVQRAEFPILMLLFILTLCVFVSYLEMGISNTLNLVLRKSASDQTAI